MIDLSLPEEVAALEAEIAHFAERELRARMRAFEADGEWDAAAVAAFDAFGVPALELPESLGGAGLGSLAKAVALEAVARGDAGGLAAADQPGPAAAALIACPDASTAGEIAGATLERSMRSVLVFGAGDRVHWAPGSSAPERTWVSDGGRLALLDTSNCETSAAVPGALHASGGVSYDLAPANALDEWTLDAEAAQALRGRARLWASAVSLGIAGAALDYGVAYAKERIVMDRPVAHHQGNAFLIAETLGMVEAARASTRAAAHRLDERFAGAGLWATLSYLDAMDAAFAATDLGVQLLGGHGYIEDHPAEKWFREARSLAQLHGGRDAALDDAAEGVLDVPDPVLG